MTNKTTQRAEYNGWKKIYTSGNKAVAQTHPNHAQFLRQFNKEKAE